MREGLGFLVSASGSEKPGAKFIPCNIHQNPVKVLVVAFGFERLWCPSFMDLSFRNMVFQDDQSDPRWWIRKGRIATGPWGAGVWWGNTLQYFAVVWIATMLLWHKAGIPEDGTAANQAPEADIIIIHYLIAYDCNYMMTYDDSS